MRLWSPAWPNGEPIPERFALARTGHDGALEPAENLSPPLAWSTLPEGTRSLALLCHDFDSPVGIGEAASTGAAMPSAFDPGAAEAGVIGALLADPVWQREIAAAHERCDFFHWVLVDIPPHTDGFAEGQWSHGFTAGGKPGADGAPGARPGLNDYTARFAGRPQLRGRYLGYDGPLPAPGDALAHHLVFALFALSIDRLALPEVFTGADVRGAIAGRVLGSATHSGTFTLNRRLAGAGA